MTNKPKMSKFIKTLTGFEVLKIEDHFHREFNQLGGARALIASAWAVRNREAVTAWADVEAMSLEEMEQLFAPEDDEDDPKAINNAA